DDSAYLLREVRGHHVDIIREVLPCACNSGYLCLPSKLALSTDFACHARHLSSKSVELVHHGIDRVLQLKNFAFHINCNLARQITTCHSGGYLGDVAHLPREFASDRY